MHRILGMLASVPWSLPPGADGWRRYVVLVMDALSPEGATPLPPTVIDPTAGDDCGA